MDNFKTNKEEFSQEDILRNEMMLLCLRLDSIEETPLIVKLLIDLTLNIENRGYTENLETKDYLDATTKVNKWIDDLEDLSNSLIH